MGVVGMKVVRFAANSRLSMTGLLVIWQLSYVHVYIAGQCEGQSSRDRRASRCGSA